MKEREENSRFKKKAMKEFGEHLVRLRRDRKLTAAKVAELSEMTASNFSRIEGGNANPTLISLLKLAQAFGLTLEGLMKGYNVK
jgi:transcriptional regulator with XRE-family HTH domain